VDRSEWREDCGSVCELGELKEMKKGDDLVCYIRLSMERKGVIKDSLRPAETNAVMYFCEGSNASVRVSLGWILLHISGPVPRKCSGALL
jgi:hypothetical protein